MKCIFIFRFNGDHWLNTGAAQDNNNNNIYLLQLGCHPVAVVILHVKIRNWLLINLSREGYMRSV